MNEYALAALMLLLWAGILLLSRNREARNATLFFLVVYNLISPFFDFVLVAPNPVWSFSFIALLASYVAFYLSSRANFVLVCAYMMIVATQFRLTVEQISTTSDILFDRYFEMMYRLEFIVVVLSMGFRVGRDRNTSDDLGARGYEPRGNRV